MAHFVSRRRSLLAAAAVFTLVTAVVVWRPWVGDSDPPGPPPLSPEQIALIDETVPSPDCVSDPPPRPEGANVALDVVHVEGTCFDVETVWTNEDDAGDTAAQLRDEPGVLAVSETPPLTLFYTEEFRFSQWGLDAVGSNSVSASPWPTGRGVTVAVLDTGIDPTHPDLRGRVVDRRHVEGEDRDPNPGYDAAYHGTHVAGIIGANANRSGIYGVVPEVNLLDVPIRTSGSNSDDVRNENASSWVVGLSWAVNMGADVVNISSGSHIVYQSQCDGVEPETPLESHCYFAAQMAVRHAVTHGTAVVAAAGNDGDAEGEKRNALSYPAAFDGVIGVGALTTDSVTPADSTSRNASVDLMAPGVEILSTVPTDAFGDRVIDSSIGAPYYEDNGTSSAAPFVSGAYAALLQAAPNASVEQITEALTQTATPLGSFTEGVGAGRVNVPAALKYLDGGGLVDAAPPTPVVYGVDAGDGETTKLMAFTGGTEVEIGSAGQDHGIRPIEFSGDGEHLLAVESSAGEPDRLVVISVPDGNRVEAEIGSGCEPRFSGGHDGSRRVVANVCGDRIEHRDVETLEVVGDVPLEIRPLNERGVLRLRGAAPGVLLFSESGLNGVERLWTVDPLTGDLQTQLEGGWTGVTQVALSSNGSHTAMVSGSTAGACATSYDAIVLDTGTLRQVSSQEPPGADASRGVYLSAPFFNGDTLYAEPLLRDLTDYPDSCAGVEPQSGGLWRLDASGWTQVSEASHAFVAPLGSIGEVSYPQYGVFVGYESDGVNVCEIVVLPWEVAVHTVENCRWDMTVVGPVADHVDMTSLHTRTRP